MYHRFLPLALCLYFLVACSSSGSESSDTEAKEYQHPYLPLHSKYNFFYNDGESASTVAFHSRRYGENVYQIEASSGFKEYFSSSRVDGIALFGVFFNDVRVSAVGTFDVNLDFKQPIRILPKNAAVGDSGKVMGGKGSIHISPTYGSRDMTYDLQYQYVTDELIDVLGVRSKAKRVRYFLNASTVIQDTLFSVSIQEELYLVEGIGIAQRNDNGVTLNLSSFTAPDSDNDGILDGLDDFPEDKNENYDHDFDGYGDNSDKDDDNDGIPDTLDSEPLISLSTEDLNNDGIGDNLSPDSDGDGVRDPFDLEPNNIHVWVNYPPQIIHDLPMISQEAGQLLTISVKNSVDIDGTIDEWSWELIDGQNINLHNAQTDTVNFVIPKTAYGQTMRLKITATDNAEKSSSEYIDISIARLFEDTSLLFELGQETVPSDMHLSFPLLTSDRELQITPILKGNLFSAVVESTLEGQENAFELWIELNPNEVGKLKNKNTHSIDLGFQLLGSDGSSALISIPIEVQLDFPQVNLVSPLLTLQDSEAAITLSGDGLSEIETAGITIGGIEVDDYILLNDDRARLITPSLSEVGELSITIPNSSGVPPFSSTVLTVIKYPVFTQTTIPLDTHLD